MTIKLDKQDLPKFDIKDYKLLKTIGIGSFIIKALTLIFYWFRIHRIISFLLWK